MSLTITTSRFRKPSSEHRCNREINVLEVRLVGADGNMVGIVPIAKALTMAQEAGLDLVEISPQALPPVCKILDYGKFRFELHKKEAEAHKKQKNQPLKEVQIRPNIGAGDYEVKKKAIIKFLNEEAKVKVVMRFRGREVQYIDSGSQIIDKLLDELRPIATFEMQKKPDLKQILVTISPLKGKAEGKTS